MELRILVLIAFATRLRLQIIWIDCANGLTQSKIAIWAVSNQILVFNEQRRPRSTTSELLRGSELMCGGRLGYRDN